MSTTNLNSKNTSKRKTLSNISLLRKIICISIYKIDNYKKKKNKKKQYQIKEQLKDKKFIKHLPYDKNHLYKQILKSLRQFHGEQSISIILMQEIKNIEILYNKALYKEATKFL